VCGVGVEVDAGHVTRRAGLMFLEEEVHRSEYSTYLTGT
jgi:hypothetical protein